ncbi:STAS domain-containing protein [bacterium]|nr:STAS domain-containing protein [bacterium]
MRIIGKDHHDIQILELAGDVDVFTSERLRARVVPAIKAERRLVLLDFSGVTYLDSAGLATVLGLWEMCGSAGGRLVLSGVAPRLRRVFRITHVQELVPVFDTQRQALTYLLLTTTAGAPGQRRILVYSSDEATLAEMVRILAALGHTGIISRRNAAGARQVLARDRVDLVVIDLWSRLTSVQRLFLNLSGPNRNVPVVVAGWARLDGGAGRRVRALALRGASLQDAGLQRLGRPRDQLHRRGSAPRAPARRRARVRWWNPPYRDGCGAPESAASTAGIRLSCRMLPV